MVTIKLLVQDPNHNFIPNIRPNNFVVYEDGVRQTIDSVEVEHAPVSIGLLVESGGRSQALNQMLGPEVTMMGRQLLAALSNQDQLAVWKYSDRVRKLTGFTRDRNRLDNIFDSLREPGISETNLYDAVITSMELMRPVPGRKAVLLVSSGVDTFSKASLQDVMKNEQQSDFPIYVTSMVPMAQQLTELNACTSPISPINWNKVEHDLEMIAEVSGGRVYAPEGTFELSAAYGDIMENLKVRYVIEYRSNTNRELDLPRSVKIELIDPVTGNPLTVADSNGKPIQISVIVEGQYTPKLTATH